MKKIITVFAICVLLGCKKEDPKYQDSIFAGTWNVEEEVEYYDGDSLVDMTNAVFTMELAEDGKGYHQSGNLKENFTWEILAEGADDLNFIHLTKNIDNAKLGQVGMFQVTEKGYDEQKWHYSFVFEPLNNQDSTITITNLPNSEYRDWSLTKIE